MQAISNNEIKRIKSLSQKKFRDEYGLFVVEGDKMVEEALHSDMEVTAVYRREEVGETAMARMSSLATPPPSLAVVRIPVSPVAGGMVSPVESPVAGGEAGLPKPPHTLTLALDALRDPGNLGTIIRTADWFGIRDIYASADTADAYNPKTVQATMGSIFRVRIHYCDLEEAAKAVKALGGSVYGTFLDGEDLYGAELGSGEAPEMIVIGNEASGISAKVAAEVTRRLTIPSNAHTRCESLNAATAAAIVMAEFRRRNRI